MSEIDTDFLQIGALQATIPGVVEQYRCFPCHGQAVQGCIRRWKLLVSAHETNSLKPMKQIETNGFKPAKQFETTGFKPMKLIVCNLVGGKYSGISLYLGTIKAQKNVLIAKLPNNYVFIELALNTFCIECILIGLFPNCPILQKFGEAKGAKRTQPAQFKLQWSMYFQNWCLLQPVSYGSRISVNLSALDVTTLSNQFAKKYFDFIHTTSIILLILSTLTFHVWKYASQSLPIYPGRSIDKLILSGWQTSGISSDRLCRH